MHQCELESLIYGLLAELEELVVCRAQLLVYQAKIVIGGGAVLLVHSLVIIVRGLK